MALPLSRSTTYLPGGVPKIKAQDLNDLQDYLAGLYAAGYSVKALSIDGTGGNVATPGSKLLVVGRSTLSDEPLAVFSDQLGHTRSAYDHIGYPAGRRSELRENWDFNFLVNTAISGASIFGGSGYSRWNGSTTNGTRNQLQTTPGGPGAAGASAEALFAGALSLDVALLYGQYPWVTLQTFVSLVMEFEISGTGGAGSGATNFWGLVDINHAGVALSNATPFFGIGAKDATANWQMIHGDGATLVYTDLGFTTVGSIGNWNRVRIELHGSGSPYGACGRLFFNDVQVGGDMTTNIPLVGVGMTPQFGVAATGASNANSQIGPLYLTYNRVALDSPTL